MNVSPANLNFSIFCWWGQSGISAIVGCIVSEDWKLVQLRMGTFEEAEAKRCRLYLVTTWRSTHPNHHQPRTQTVTTTRFLALSPGSVCVDLVGPFVAVAVEGLGAVARLRALAASAEALQVESSGLGASLKEGAVCASSPAAAAKQLQFLFCQLYGAHSIV